MAYIMLLQLDMVTISVRGILKAWPTLAFSPAATFSQPLEPCSRMFVQKSRSLTIRIPSKKASCGEYVDNNLTASNIISGGLHQKNKLTVMLRMCKGFHCTRLTALRLSSNLLFMPTDMRPWTRFGYTRIRMATGHCGDWLRYFCTASWRVVMQNNARNSKVWRQS